MKALSWTFNGGAVVLWGRIMQRVEQKLAEWKALYDQANAARSRLREATQTSDSDKIDQYTQEAARLGAESEWALQAVHEALAKRVKR
jgi:hypothetical protein